MIALMAMGAALSLVAAIFWPRGRRIALMAAAIFFLIGAVCFAFVVFGGIPAG